MIALNRTKRSSLFFIEMIVSLLFFSISGAVILKVFAAADIRASENSAREAAVLCAQSAAEVYSVSGDIDEVCERVFGGGKSGGDGEYTLLLDSNFRAVNSGGAVTLKMTETRTDSPAGTLCVLELSFSASEKELFGMECSAYIPARGGAANE